ncbi:MAG: efflux transporter periplasmic adaptor subunit [Tardiphaga sp.]|nr:efflux transporter periplasmic adaptor subunit [Tardiphaga sp.]
MDQRTPRSDAEAAPEHLRTAPAPIIKSRRGGRSRLVGLIILIAVLLGGYLIFRFHSSTQPVGGAGHTTQAAPQPVGAATIGQGDIRVIINALGTVTPIATITVQTQINGQLQEVAFTEGQMVKKGDFLAQIDPRPYQLLQAQYEGQLARDQGVLAQARVDLARYKTLTEQNSIARQQYEDQIYIVQQDEGTVKLDQALIDQQKLNVAYCHIVSPVTGRIGLRLVDPGNYLQTTNTTGVAVVTQLQPITVIFPVPEDDLPDILSQQKAGAPLEVYAYDRANIRSLATGHVAALDSQIDTTTGTAKLRAQFDNGDNALFPNQFVNAQLVVNTLHNAVTVPTAAIQHGAPGTYVYVINANDSVSVRPVSMGPTDGPMAAVSSGLSVGERVVVDGTDRLRDGARVTIAGARSATSATSTNAAPGGGPKHRAGGGGQ